MIVKRLRVTAILLLFASCSTARPAPRHSVLRYQDLSGQWQENKGEVVPPVLLTRDSPAWPMHLRTLENTGAVLLHALIDRDGNVEDVVLVKSVSKPMDTEAMDTVKRWKYKPASFDGAAVPVWYHVTVSFSLH